MLSNFVIFLKIVICIILTSSSLNATEIDETIAKNYSTSIVALEKLLQMEKLLLDNMNAFATKLEEKISIMQLFLDNLKIEQKKSTNNSELYLSNPLNSFSLLRRLNADWKHWHLYMKKSVGKAQTDYFETLRSHLPVDKDLGEAAFGIQLIKTVYLLKTEDIALGFLNGKQYDASLTALDCYAIGLEQYKRSNFESSIEWLNLALKRYNSTNDKIYEILDFNIQQQSWFSLAKNYKNLERYKLSLNAINAALLYNSNAEELFEFRSKLLELMNNIAVCQGKYLTSRRLHCCYNTTTTAFLILAPLKMEILHLDPYIVVYHDVISENESNQLKHKALPTLKRSLVGNGTINPGRTAHSTYFKESVQLQNRIVDMTGFDMAGAEKLQVTNYGIGGHHFNHVDYFNFTVLPDFLASRGDRIAAVIFYLNDVEQGGATIFPRIKLAVPAKKGTALLWYHLDETSHGNRNSMHASCTIVAGSKWVAISVLYERPQMFKRLCYNRK